MKQNILRKLMLIAVLLTCVNAFAHDFEFGGIYYNITSSSGLTVEVTYKGSSSGSYSNEYSGQVTIPKTVPYNSKIYSVTSIGDYAFSGCSGLTSVNIPNIVTSIGYAAFSGCSGLTSVTIGNSVTSIGESAFSDCSGLTSVTIGNSVTSIGDYAFFDCSGLTSVYISDLEAWCKIDFSNPVSNPLYYAKNLYLNGELLTNIEIPNSITEIKQFAFDYCTGLKSVTIPNSVTSIGNYAFSDCTNLTEVTLGSSVKEIGSSAFYRAKRLGKIYSLNPTPPTCANEDVFYNVNKDKCRVYVLVGAGEDYKTTYVWWDFNNIVEKEMSGVESTLTDNDVNVVVENGNIIVNGADTNIEVYSTNGLCVYNGTDTGIAVNTKGLYIVKVNGKSFKVIL